MTLHDLFAKYNDRAYVGFLFVCAIANANKGSSFVSKLSTYAPQKTVRNVKKEFMLNIRDYFSESDKKGEKGKIAKSKKKPLPEAYNGEILGKYLERIVINNQDAMPSIEGVIKTAKLNDEASLARLGEAVIDGAETYHRSVETGGGEVYFQEYDLILSHLTTKLKQ